MPNAGADPQKNTLEAYTSNIAALNVMIAKALERVGGSNLAPGGTVKVVSASSGSISLAEDFARPLVIGYLGFDMAIGPAGLLGPPMPTHAVLERGVSPALRGDLGVRLSSTAALAIEYQTLRPSPRWPKARGARRRSDAARAIVPPPIPATSSGPQSRGPSRWCCAGRSRRAGFDRVPTYRGRLYSRSPRSSGRSQCAASSRAFPARADAEKYLREQLAANESALKALDDEIRRHETLLTRTKVYLAGVEG